MKISYVRGLKEKGAKFWLVVGWIKLYPTHYQLHSTAPTYLLPTTHTLRGPVRGTEDTH